MFAVHIGVIIFELMKPVFMDLFTCGITNYLTCVSRTLLILHVQSKDGYCSVTRELNANYAIVHNCNAVARMRENGKRMG